jgi:hypothetical protein
MKQTTFACVAGLLLALGAAQAEAQVAMTPRALGMGGAYDGVARGQEAIFVNPALLGLTGNPFWSAAFPQVAFGGTMLGTQFGDLQPMLKYRRATEEQRDEILARIPADGMQANYELRSPLAAFQTGNFGIGLSYSSVGQHSVGRDVMELLFDGYQQGRTDYSVGETRGSRATFWDVAAAYGRSIGPVSIGATGHYYRGGTLVRSVLMEPTYDLIAQDIEVSYRTVMARGGQGYGLDVGAAIQPIRSVTLSGSVSNVRSSMTWSDDLRMRTLTMNRHDVEHANAMELLDRYEASETSVDPNGGSLEAYAVSQGLYENTEMPSTLRLAAAWKGALGTDIGVSYREELSESRLGEIWSRSVGAGVQQKVLFTTLRAGYSTDLDGGSMATGGVSLGPLQLGFARIQDGDVDGFERAGWIGTFGVSVRTTGSMRTPGAIR